MSWNASGGPHFKFENDRCLEALSITSKMS